MVNADEENVNEKIILQDDEYYYKIDTFFKEIIRVAQPT